MSYAVQQGAYGSACDPAQPTSISPASRNFSSGAADGNVSVSKSPDCAWSVGALPGWIVARTAMGGVGAATFGYSVLANTGPVRSATLTVAGKNHLVTQDAAPLPPRAPSRQPLSASLIQAHWPAATASMVRAGHAITWSAMLSPARQGKVW